MKRSNFPYSYILDKRPESRKVRKRKVWVGGRKSIKKNIQIRNE